MADEGSTVGSSDGKKRAPNHVRNIAVLSFVALLALALLVVLSDPLRQHIAAHHLGRLPAGIIWFGAVGGSLASLTGIFRHDERDWNDAWNLWHKMRPGTGAVMGSLGAFFLLVSTEIAGPVTGSQPVKANVYFAAAFMAGFAEKPFRALVKRLTDALYGNPRCCTASPCDDCKQRARDSGEQQPEPPAAA